MKTTTWAIVIIVIAVIAGLWLWFGFQPNSAGETTNPTSVATSTTSGSPSTQSTSDGTITFFMTPDFGLATNQQQILVSAVIPPCDGTFNYCLYYDNTSTYQGTNFESAGLRIEKRNDLTTQSQCLNMPPDGYTNLKPTTIASSSDYAVSGFSNIGGGAAGSFASGVVYHLAYDGSCYEFETRIAQSQFANYPSGTIQQFTASDQAALQSEIRAILGKITLPSGEMINFPQV